MGKLSVVSVACDSLPHTLELRSSITLEGNRWTVKSMSVCSAGIGDVLALFHGLLVTNKKKSIDFINPITYEQRLTIVWYKMKISDINGGTR